MIMRGNCYEVMRGKGNMKKILGVLFSEDIKWKKVFNIRTTRC